MLYLVIWHHPSLGLPQSPFNHYPLLHDSAVIGTSVPCRLCRSSLHHSINTSLPSVANIGALDHHWFGACVRHHWRSQRGGISHHWLCSHFHHCGCTPRPTSMGVCSNCCIHAMSVLQQLHPRPLHVVRLLGTFVLLVFTLLVCRHGVGHALYSHDNEAVVGVFT